LRPETFSPASPADKTIPVCPQEVAAQQAPFIKAQKRPPNSLLPFALSRLFDELCLTIKNHPPAKGLYVAVERPSVPSFPPPPFLGISLPASPSRFNDYLLILFASNQWFNTPRSCSPACEPSPASALFALANRFIVAHFPVGNRTGRKFQ